MDTTNTTEWFGLTRVDRLIRTSCYKSHVFDAKSLHEKLSRHLCFLEDKESGGGGGGEDCLSHRAGDVAAPVHVHQSEDRLQVQVRDLLRLDYQRDDIQEEILGSFSQNV